MARCEHKVTSAERIPSGASFHNSPTHQATYLTRVRRCAEPATVTVEKHPDYWPASHLPGTKNLCAAHADELIGLQPSGRPRIGWRPVQP